MDKKFNPTLLKKGDLGIPKNYRGIILTLQVEKVYNAMLPNRNYPEILKVIGKNQNGFLRKRATASQILIIGRIIEGVRAKKKTKKKNKNRKYYCL